MDLANVIASIEASGVGEWMRTSLKSLPKRGSKNARAEADSGCPGERSVECTDLGASPPIAPWAFRATVTSSSSSQAAHCR